MGGRQKFFRGWPMKYYLLLISSLVALSSVGCCTPTGCGLGCRQLDGCYDCDGGFGPGAIPGGPIEALRQTRRSLVCGGGCGEVYWGEWRSTPPDCQDPCCGDEFVGGATPCRPFCWQPGTLLRGLYGTRFACESCGSAADCGCDGEAIGYSGDYIESTHSAGADCNCQAHGGGVAPANTGVVRQLPAARSMAQAKPASQRSARPLSNAPASTAVKPARDTRVIR